MFNLLRWAHQSLRHYGGRGVEPENSLRILQGHEETDYGVNCVMMVSSPYGSLRQAAQRQLRSLSRCR
jgi:hypothetical protein